MGSPRCTLNHWGSGTGSTTTNTTESAKELNDKLKKMMAERDKIDNLWTTPTEQQPQQQQQQPPNPNNSTKTGK